MDAIFPNSIGKSGNLTFADSRFPVSNPASSERSVAHTGSHVVCGGDGGADDGVSEMD